MASVENDYLYARMRESDWAGGVAPLQREIARLDADLLQWAQLAAVIAGALTDCGDVPVPAVAPENAEQVRQTILDLHARAKAAETSLSTLKRVGLFLDDCAFSVTFADRPPGGEGRSR